MRRKQREQGNREPRYRIFIVCEDSKSGPRYWKALRKLLHAKTFAFEVVESSSNETSPQQVVERALKSLEDPDEADVAWAVIDADLARKSARKAELDAAYQAAGSDQRVRVAVSNPCFEYWLLLHLEEVNQGCTCQRDAERECDRAWQENGLGPYRKGRVDFCKLVSRGRPDEAAERAYRRHAQQGCEKPHKCEPRVTDVYKLYNELKKRASQAP
ncbi:MAG: RloB family protein [Planctomycetota bacterium]|nr:RloB family protein [Planctomycetota bacterium]